MKSFFTFILVVMALSVSAQEGVIVKYFDSLWHPTIKKFASFYTEFKKKDTVYLCTSRYLPSNKLFCVSTYSDTNFTRGYGTIVRRSESGLAMDSTFIINNGKALFKYHYNESGTLISHSYFDTISKSNIILNFYKNNLLQDSISLKNDTDIVAYSYYENKKIKAITKWNKDLNEYIGEGFDESGKLIPNYIYQKPATFKGGKSEWRKYLERNLKSSLPSRKGAPVGRYSVYVYFTVNEKGELANINSSNDPGYGTKEEAIRVLQKCPNWSPAINYNSPVTYRAIQKITFEVAENNSYHI